MRVRSAVLTAVVVVLAVPCTVLGVDAAVRWHPRPNAGVAARVAAAADLDEYLRIREDSVPGVKPALRKGIVWHDPARRSRTRIALVYLHGFSASRGELSPVVERLADSLGANAFFTRLAAHGRADGEAFANVSPQQWIDDAREALAIGRRLGERVILVGTSTGAVLAMALAAEAADSNAPAALILVSPNHEPADRRGRLVAGPFGRVVARIVGGRYLGFTPANAAQAERWTTRYRSEGVASLMDLVLFGQTIDVARIATPVLTLYTHADDVVRVDLIRSRHAAFGSRVKQIVDVPEANNHVLAGDALTPRAVDPVVALMLRFIEASKLRGSLPTNAQ